MREKETKKIILLIFSIVLIIVSLAFGATPNDDCGCGTSGKTSFSLEGKLVNSQEIMKGFEQGEEKVKVIVNLVEPPNLKMGVNWKSKISRQELHDRVRSLQSPVLAALNRNEFKLRHRFKNQAGFSGEVTLKALEKLIDNPVVESVEPVVILKPHLNQGIPLIGADLYRSTYTGQGAAIAICDTGVDYTHPMLGNGSFPNNKVIGGYDCGDNDNDPMPYNGVDEDYAHGTCCAGIAAGDLGTVGDYIGGVAHSTKIYALKITSGSNTVAFNDDMIEAWNWCITHNNDDPENPILVISTSFGDGRNFSSCDSSVPAMTTAANNAVSAGITVLVSSGNDGYCDAINWPACISSVISVGAVYDSDFGVFQPCVNEQSCVTKYSGGGCETGYYAIDIVDVDMVTSYSNTASFLDIFAPSNRCYTTDIVGTNGYSSGNYSTDFGGTSAACPYAAGAVACLQEAALDLNGSFLTPEEVRNILTSTGDNITDGKVAITKPRINLAEAIESLGNKATFTSISDTYAYEAFPNNNYGNQDYIFVDKLTYSLYMHGFIKFDLSSLPTGSTINFVQLDLSVYDYPSSPYAHLIGLRENISSWTESGVTWNNMPINDDWSDPVIADPFDQGDISVWTWDSEDYPQLKAVAQQWSDNPGSNYGINIRCSVSQPGVIFYSKEYSVANKRPTLTVKYSVPPGDSFEPDDNYQQATEILSGASQNHSIFPATDIDWLKFILGGESEVVIETSGSSGNTRLWLYNDSLTELEYDNDNGVGAFSRIDRLCGTDSLPAGNYYIKVDEYGNNDEISSYDIVLTINGCPGPPGELQFNNANYNTWENSNTAIITVIRINGSYGSVAVNYSSSDGIAIEDYDYQPASGTLNFSDSETAKTFAVGIIDDNLVEDNETIDLILSNPSGGASLGSQSSAELIIIDNEPDLNDDGKIDSSDFSLFSLHWLDVCFEPERCEGSDFDASSVVDSNDLTKLVNHWLALKYDVLYHFNLNSDPGWTTGGEWAFGQPTGNGGTSNGNPDPSSGYTGNNVYGVNLNGDYIVAPGGPYYLTAGPSDCSGYSYVNLKFARWLNTDEPDYVGSKIEVSNNGTTWQTVWEHTGNQPITDSNWQIIEHDISAVADNQPTVYIRLSYEIISDEAYAYSGWNIDDIQLWGVD